MKNVKVDEFINTKPEFLMITCKEVEKNGKKCYRYIFKQQFNESCKDIKLTQQERDTLINLSKNCPKEFLDSLIQVYLKDDLITSIYEGTNLLLPPNFRQFYDRCITISTKNHQIYFNDLAIEKFKDTILKLNERSKIDSLNFVRGKLESKKVNNMQLYLENCNSFKIGRDVKFIEESRHICVGPNNTVYYSAPVSKKGKVDVVDMNNTITLMEEFTKYKGLAQSYYNNRGDDAITLYYNNGKLEIIGLNNNLDFKEKVQEKVKQLLIK
ncbi:MAG: hypothetical protein IJY25_02165 [Bacilli bacterium]|nr:hypothetical protein [Bacilli bacterium]